jgi:hypothetical protein
MIEGLTAFTVTMTGTSLDVILTRTGGEPSEELVRAAQMLADRLSQRFGSRSVRVLDDSRDEALASEPGHGGLRGIAQILGGRSKTP